ncbi:MAG: hypothetical protein JNK00_10740 [Flavipsychrobacter sp.]|nr:hypothetical protein [Flavipsychrobacter sp.]
MVLKAIFYLISFMLVFFQGYAQSESKTVSIQCAMPSPEYNIYEINKIFFSFPSYGQGLIISPKHLVAGKQYFKRKLPRWLRVDLRQENKLPSGTTVKLYQGNRAIDTFLYKGIELKYPLEVDGKMLNGNTISNKETQPIIINGFQFVKECAKYPYKHFEIITQK